METMEAMERVEMLETEPRDTAAVTAGNLQLAWE